MAKFDVHLYKESMTTTPGIVRMTLVRLFLLIYFFVCPVWLAIFSFFEPGLGERIDPGMATLVCLCNYCIFKNKWSVQANAIQVQEF